MAVTGTSGQYQDCNHTLCFYPTDPVLHKHQSTSTIINWLHYVENILVALLNNTLLHMTTTRNRETTSDEIVCKTKQCLYGERGSDKLVHLSVYSYNSLDLLHCAPPVNKQKTHTACNGKKSHLEQTIQAS